MKTLKNASLFIIVLVGFVFGSMSVNAYVGTPCEDNSGLMCVNGGSLKAAEKQENMSGATQGQREVAGKNSGSSWNLQVKKSDGSYMNNPQFYSYTFNGAPMWCLDANKKGATNLYASRFLLQQSQNNIWGTNTYYHDIAMMSVLTNSMNAMPGTDDNMAASIAIRMVDIIFGLDQDGGTDEIDSALNKAYAGTAYKWLIEDSYYPESKDAYASLENQLEKDYPRFMETSALAQYSSSKFESVAGTSSAALQKARELVNQAIIEAAKHTEGGVNGVSSTGGAKVSAQAEATDSLSPQTTSDSIGELVYLDVKYVFTLENFTNDGKASFQITKLQYEKDLAALGVKEQPKIMSVTVGSKEICSEGSCSLGTNLLESGFASNEEAKNTTITVTMRFQGYKSVKVQGSAPVLKCGEQPMKWFMEYAYSDTGSSEDLFPDYVGIVWYGRNNDNTQGVDTTNQRYVSVVPREDTPGENPGMTGKVEGEVTLIEDCNCDLLAEACKSSGNLSSPECNEFFAAGCGECSELEVKCALGDQAACKDMEEVCEATCEGSVEGVWECCDSDQLTVSTTDDHEVNIYGPKDDKVKACFVTQINKQKESNGSKGYDGIEGTKDGAGNSYTLEQNKYCHVSCKEDYEMYMPNAKLVNAGRYFTFKAKVLGTKNCYTADIDREQYVKDILQAQKEIYQAFNEWKDWETASKSNPHDGPIANPCTSCSSKDCSSTCTGHTEYVTGSLTNPYTYTAYRPKFNEKTGEITEVGPYEAHGQKTASSITHDVEGCSAECPRTCTDDDGDSYDCSTSTSMEVTVIDEVRDGAWLASYIAQKMAEAHAKLVAAQQKYAKYIADYKHCSDWESEIVYNADVYYDYDEVYMKEIRKGEMDAAPSGISTSEWYCNGNFDRTEGFTPSEVNTTYESCNMNSNSKSEHNMTYVHCDDDKCYEDKHDISDATYKKITSEIEVNYKPKTLFYNIYPSGKVVAINNARDAKNAVELPNRLPVDLKTARGIYKYTLNMTNIGEFYQEGNLGRLVGSPTAEVDTDKIEYMCSYLVNIIETNGWICDFDDQCTDDCISNCQGPNCGDDVCDGDNCVAECIGVGCIYDSEAGFSVYQKQVTLNNLFPNGTDSYNWDRNSNDKAKDTLQEIEEKGEEVYAEDPILSVTIGPDDQKKIESYNDSEGGVYSNDNMNCYSLGGNERAACYSEFIDDVLNGSYGTVDQSSKIAQSGYRRTTDVSGARGEYFEMWNGYNPDLKDMDEKGYEYGTFEYYMLGPSWK